MTTGLRTLIVNTSQQVNDWLKQHQPDNSVALLDPAGHVVFMQKTTEASEFSEAGTANPPYKLVRNVDDRTIYFDFELEAA